MIRLALLRLLESYFRHRWLHLLPLVLLSVAAGAYLLLVKPDYVTHGVLYVQNESLLSSLNSIQDEGFSWITPAQATVDEIRELMQSAAFTRAVIQRTDLESEMSRGPQAVEETISGVQQAVWVQAQGSNQVLVGASHEDPNIAFQLVSAIIDTYIQWQINSDVRQSSTAQTFFDGLIAEYQRDVAVARDELEDYFETHPAPLRGERPPPEQLEIEGLRGAVDLARNRYANALEKQENAKLALAETESDIRQTYYVLDAPRLPTSPETSKRQMAQEILIFVATGVLLTGISIAGSAVLDRSLRFPTDVHQRIQLPVVGIIPSAPVDFKTAPVVHTIPEAGEVDQVEGSSESDTVEHPNGGRVPEQVSA